MKRLIIGAAFALTCLLSSACDRVVEEPAPAQPAHEASDLENDNLLNIVFGAAVIDRTNELSYESAVAHAFDGSRMTHWSSAPGGKLTTIVSLAAPTRLERLGVTVPKARASAPAAIRFEASLDRSVWRKVLETDLDPESGNRQMFDITPVDARYLRITAIEPVDYYSVILSLHADGGETAPFVQPPLQGCWEINSTEQARFERFGARVVGAIGDMIIDGGTDGRVYRLMWREGMNWGYAAVSVSADGQHLSGVRWHEEINPKHSGDAWLGRRVPCKGSAAIDGANIVDLLIRRAALWRMYGVRFDRQQRIVESESTNALDLAAKLVREHPRHHFRIVAREFRASTTEKNLEWCRIKLDSMREALRTRGADLARIEFVVGGTERHPLSVDFTSQRVMDSVVDLQVLPLR